ncbi:MAG: transcriptional repressor [Desulfobacteraceae bacterium]|jgi:Fur family ferric uptake transcriptional regulator
MLNQHQLEKDNFRALIENDSIGNVEERLNIIDVFLEVEEHITLEELNRRLKEKGYDYDIDFVKECMTRWVKYGFAQKKEFEGQPILYEHRHLGKHHDHLICTKCGKITEFENAEIERLQAAVAANHGFHMLQHKMEVYGLCSDCIKHRKPLMPLTMGKPGENLVITEMRAGRHARSRLSSLGLNPGDRVEIINNNNDGRLVIGHKQTRIAIGRGIGEKILVTVHGRNESPAA